MKVGGVCTDLNQIEGRGGGWRNLTPTTCFHFLCALQKVGNQILRNTDLADKGPPPFPFQGFVLAGKCDETVIDCKESLGLRD